MGIEPGKETAMIIQGQVELSCVFGRIGCLKAELHAEEPFRDVEFPAGARWFDGAEYMRLKGISEKKAGCGWRGKPDYVVQLPPDWEAVALWVDGESGFIEGMQWAEYPDDKWRDLTGMHVDEWYVEEEDEHPSDDPDWWQEWFDAPSCLLSDAGAVPPDEKNRGRNWNYEQWWALMDALDESADILKRGYVINRANQKQMVTDAVKKLIMKWRTDFISILHNDPYVDDLDAPVWEDICGWCLRPLPCDESNHPTEDGLVICKDCGKEYDEENRLIQLERDKIEGVDPYSDI